MGEMVGEQASESEAHGQGDVEPGSVEEERA